MIMTTNNMKLCILGLFLQLVLSGAQFPAQCSCPDSCICSLPDKTIDCVNQQLKHIPVELNSCSWPGITKVDLSSNRIKFVHEFAFSLLGNITHLFLFDNLIEEVDRSAFIGLHSLENLYLDGNRLSSLPYSVFWPLSHLKKLLLYGNLLTDLPLGIFQYQHLLTRLALYDNRLSILHTEVFDDLPLLQELYLHNNHISNLSAAPFRSLRQLKTLYLNDNRLTQLTRFDFLGLNTATGLYLSNNRIASIQDDTFQPMLKLQFLYLENNQLSEINLLVFAGPVELLLLRVFNNQIETISDGAFFRLTNLQRLALYNNRLSQITTQTFVGLESLTELNLYGNQIQSLPNDSFSQSPFLRQLWLYDNELTCIEVAAFRGLGNLELLQLGQNRLSYLPEEVFSYTPSLVYLLLYANDFQTINNRPFRNLHHLVQLSLTSNSIEYIAEGALDGSKSIFYFQWSTISSLNSLRCDCSALWLYQWVVSRTVQSSIICASPSEFLGQDIRSLKPASFGCSVDNLRITLSSASTDIIVARNGCLHLFCSSDPRGPIRWSRVDGRALRPVLESCSSTSPCGQGLRGEGVLVVEGVREEDVGHYVCTASFQNQTAARAIQVLVGDPPVLLEGPEEVVLSHPGVLARLHLSFSGSPWPEVTWSRVSLTGEEQALVETGPDSRYIVSKNGSLVIPETTLADEGTYRAVLSNGAGELVVDVTLSFLYETSCHGSCFNGGTCVDISVCMCPSHYGGSSCEIAFGPSEATPTTTPTATPITRDISDLEDSDFSGSGSGDTTDTTDTIDTTEPFSGLAPDDTTNYDDITDITTVMTTPVGTEHSTVRIDTEGLVDDEDYMVTTAQVRRTNSGSGHSEDYMVTTVQVRRTNSGSGYSEFTTEMEIDPEMSGSGMGHENRFGQRRAESRRKRGISRRNVVLYKTHLQTSPASTFQEIIRNTFERQKAFEAELKEARIAAKRRSKNTFVKTLTPVPVDHMTAGGDHMTAGGPRGGDHMTAGGSRGGDHMTAGGSRGGDHMTTGRDTVSHGDDHMSDGGVSAPGLVYLHKEEGLRSPTSKDLHKI